MIRDAKLKTCKGNDRKLQGHAFHTGRTDSSREKYRNIFIGKCYGCREDGKPFMK